MRLAIAAFVVVLCLMAKSGVQAQSPTPAPTITPTPGPYVAPTGEYQNIRPTPTLLSITPSPIPIDLSGKAGELADTAINMYRWVNFGATSTTGGVIDFIMFGAMGYFVIRALIYLVNNFRGD